MSLYNKLAAIVILVYSSVSYSLPASHSHSSNNFLVITDIHLDQASAHTMEISPAGYRENNDLDSNTFTTLMHRLDRAVASGYVSKPDFVIVLGDIVGHARASFNDIKTSEHTVFTRLAQTFHGTPILYVPGNNDSLKDDYARFSDNSIPGNVTSAYDVAKLEAGWKDGFLSSGQVCHSSQTTYPCLMNENKRDGYYTVKLKDHLTLIALNTTLFSVYRQGVTEKDARAQLSWLGKQLASAHANGDSVLLAMHIPPGYNMYDNSAFWKGSDLHHFLKLVVAYKETIIGMLAGHTHMDTIKILRDDRGNNFMGIYSIAGLSTGHGNEPSLKTFYLSTPKHHWELSNYETYHFSQIATKIKFRKLYAFRHEYCDNQIPTSMTLCLHNVTAEKIKKYYAAGNQKNSGEIGAPQAIYLDTF